MKRRLRGPAALAISALTAVGAAGCAVFSPVQTQYPYEPGDGFSTIVGPVAVRNTVVVSEGEGAPGALSVTFINNTQEPAEISVRVSGAEETSIPVPVGVAVVVGDDSPQVSSTVRSGAGDPEVPASLRIPSVDAIPGTLIPVTFESAGQTVEISAPVLLPRLEYSTIAPTPGSGTGSGDPTPAPGRTATDEPEPLEDGVTPDGRANTEPADDSGSIGTDDSPTTE